MNTESATDPPPLRFTFAETYERSLVEPLFRPWVDGLLDRAQLAPGDRLLDLASGTGIVARLARERVVSGGRRMVGVDLSPQMLAVGSRLAPDVAWCQASAVALPFTSGTFDVLVCQQGLQFFPDRLAAVREMHRVLKAGGRAIAATWRALDEMPLLLALHASAERHLGPVADRRHSLADGGALERLFVEAGFHDVRVGTVSKTIHFDDAAAFIRLNAMALVGMSQASQTMSEEDRARLIEAIAADSIETIRPYAGPESLAFAMSTNVAAARV